MELRTNIGRRRGLLGEPMATINSGIRPLIIGFCLLSRFAEGQFGHVTVYPLYGPVAGGTEVTIQGPDLEAVRVAEVVLGGFTDLRLPIIERGPDSVRVRTPEVSSVLAGSNHPVILYVDNVASHVSGHQFQFRPNPVIDSTWPLRTIHVGGIVQHVTGQFLDSVARPLMEVNMTYQNDSDTRRATFHAECETHNSRRMSCWTPQFDLNTEILESLPKNEQDVSGLVQLSQFEVQFRMDGLHIDNNDTLRVYNSIPVFETIDEVVDYRAGSDSTLVLQGRHLDVGVSEDDYQVDVGASPSTDLALYSSRLVHRPPQSKPPPKAASPGGDTRQVVVHVGRYLRYHVGHMRYVSIPTAAILAGVATAIVVLIILVALSLTRRRRLRREKGMLNEARKNSTQGQEGNSVPDQSAKTCNKDNTSDEVITLPKVEDMFGEERYIVI